MDQARSQIKEIIEQYKDTLRKRGIQVERVILYGSFAKGNPTDDSDIDLIVVSENFQTMNLRERLEALGAAAARIMKPIEAKGYTAREIESASKNSFLHEILTGGVPI